MDSAKKENWLNEEDYHKALQFMRAWPQWKRQMVDSMQPSYVETKLFMPPMLIIEQKGANKR